MNSKKAKGTFSPQPLSLKPKEEKKKKEIKEIKETKNYKEEN